MLTMRWIAMVRIAGPQTQYYDDEFTFEGQYQSSDYDEMEEPSGGISTRMKPLSKVSLHAQCALTCELLSHNHMNLQAKPKKLGVFDMPNTTIF